MRLKTISQKPNSAIWIREQKEKRPAPALPTSGFDIDATARDLKILCRRTRTGSSLISFRIQAAVITTLQELNHMDVSLRQRWHIEE